MYPILKDRRRNAPGFLGFGIMGPRPDPAHPPNLARRAEYFKRPIVARQIAPDSARRGPDPLTATPRTRREGRLSRSGRRPTVARGVPFWTATPATPMAGPSSTLSTAMRLTSGSGSPRMVTSRGLRFSGHVRSGRPSMDRDQRLERRFQARPLWSPRASCQAPRPIGRKN